MKTQYRWLSILLLFAALIGSPALLAGGRPHQASNTQEPTPAPPQYDFAANYTKFEVEIPMRDGVKLFTSIAAPKDVSRNYPILLTRTTYGVAPYGPGKFPDFSGTFSLF